METEEHFELTLHDEDAEKMVTVGDLHTFVWKKVQARNRWTEKQCSEEVGEIVECAVGLDARGDPRTRVYESVSSRVCQGN